MSESPNKRKAEDEAPDAPPAKSPSSSSKAAPPKAPTDDDPDWDDDKPICELMAVYMKKRHARAIAKAREEVERAAAKASRPKSSGGGGGSSNRVAAPTRKDALYYDTQKGNLVQKLLVRWWYAFQWPKAGDWDVKDIPKGYEELDGFPGVFVSMDVTTLGNIIDLRNNDMKPSLTHMSKKHPKEIQDLCILAYENQMKALEEAEGGSNDNTYLHELKRELHTVKKIDAESAELAASKFKF